MNFEIHDPTYLWSIRIFRVLRKMLGINLRLHQADATMDDGDILVFNHFARFETFIPQFFVYEETGAKCRSIAAAELVSGDDALPTFLRRVGAVSNTMPGLLPFLAAEVLRGRKVVVFPEGGMVKDRRAMDDKGRLLSYSRTAGEHRSPHTGAAVLALALEMFKTGVREAEAAGDGARLAAMAASAGVDVDALLTQAHRPTRILPANITFYPIRVGENLLSRGFDLFNQSGPGGAISDRLAEEMLVEGNLLLRDTDMDIRLSKPVDVAESLSWWERGVMKRMGARLRSVDDAFGLRADTAGMGRRTLYRGVRRRVERLRDSAMRGVYEAVSVNLSHVASVLVYSLLEAGQSRCDEARFQHLLYLAVKALQADGSVDLHRSLRNPDFYAPLVSGSTRGLDDFLDAVRDCDLIEREDGRLTFLPKLREEHDFDRVRIENPLAVYVNEALPARGVRRAVDQALKSVNEVSPSTLARYRFDDIAHAFAFDRLRFLKPEYAAINAQATATADPKPYLLEPEPAQSRAPAGTALVLVHGFLASPAELRGFGERAAAAGYTVVGTRLRGHGTSPWDLRERKYDQWLRSVHAALEVAAGLAQRVVLVGFSLGGALALVAAARWPAKVSAVVAVCPPFRPRNRNMALVPVVLGANALVRAVSPADGILPFTPSNSENPDVNYAHMPVSALNELRGFIRVLHAEVGDVQCPTLVVQATNDPVVVPKATLEAVQGFEHFTVVEVESDRHGILREDIGGTQAIVLDFIAGR